MIILEPDHVLFKMETSENTLTQKPDLTIMTKNNTLEIVEASEDKVKIKSNRTGLVNGSLYYGSYNYTVKRRRLFDRGKCRGLTASA